jgi:hypothetical protein
MLLRALNVSKTQRSGSGSQQSQPANASSRSSAAEAEWDALPKLMAVELATGRATFFRGDLRTQLCSDWLELLVRGRLTTAAQWFDVTDVLREVHN